MAERDRQARRGDAPGEPPDDLVEIGRFGRPHGVRGAIRFWAHNRGSPLVRARRTVWIGRRLDAVRPVRITGVRHDAKGAVVRIDGVEDRDGAGEINGMRWFEPRGGFAALDEEDAYYIADLVGLTVRTEGGRHRGRLADVWQFGEVDIYVVRGGGHEYLVPALGRYVLSVDLAAGEMVVSEDAGLLEDEAD